MYSLDYPLINQHFCIGVNGILHNLLCSVYSIKGSKSIARFISVSTDYGWDDVLIFNCSDGKLGKVFLRDISLDIINLSEITNLDFKVTLIASVCDLIRFAVFEC